MNAQPELQVEYVVDDQGAKRAVIVEYELWEEIIARLEDLEDALEMRRLREHNEESIPWEQAKAELGLDNSSIRHLYNFRWPAPGKARQT